MIASELKVYRDTYELASVIVDLQGRFPRLYKHTIGQRMTDTALGLFEHIQLANMYKEHRTRHLSAFIVKFELLKTMVRLASEKHMITLKEQADISRRTAKIGRQIIAWKNTT